MALTKKTVDAAAAPASGAAFLWDDHLSGFGVRITASGVKSFVLQYRPKGSLKSRRTTIGRYGPLTVAQARQEAQRLLASISLGADPVADARATRAAAAVQELTVNDLLDKFLVEHVVRNLKPKTQLEFRLAFDRLVRPYLGSLKLTAITRGDLKRWHADITSRGAPSYANRALAYLRRALRFAHEYEMIAANPAENISRNREAARDRFLSDDELRRIGDAIRDLDAAGRLLPSVGPAVHLLALTGLRIAEARDLRWSDYDRRAGLFRLADSKTGARHVPLCPEAMTLLDGMERVGDFIIPGSNPRGPIAAKTLATGITRIFAAAGVDDATPHAFRHGYATFMAQAGADVWSICHACGWKTIEMASRYVARHAIGDRHPAPAGERIAAALGGIQRRRDPTETPAFRDRQLSLS